MVRGLLRPKTVQMLSSLVMYFYETCNITIIQITRTTRVALQTKNESCQVKISWRGICWGTTQSKTTSLIECNYHCICKLLRQSKLGFESCQAEIIWPSIYWGEIQSESTSFIEYNYHHENHHATQVELRTKRESCQSWNHMTLNMLKHNSHQTHVFTSQRKSHTR